MKLAGRSGGGGEPYASTATERSGPSPRPLLVSSRAGIALSLLVLYSVWGSTYLAIRVALEGFPPFRLGALRFLVAGGALLLFAMARGARLPTLRQWRNSVWIGTLLLAIGNGGVVYAEVTVGSGLAALVVSGMPLWMALFSGLFGKWPAVGDWLALGLGGLGILLLNLGSDLHANPAGMVALLLSSSCWAFGSLWSRRLDLPVGLMAAAAQMLGGGAVSFVVSLAIGEHFASVPSARALAAFFYLVVFGSLLAFSAYLYLLARVRPTVASSYAYVNPLVAMLLGATLGHESIPLAAVLAAPLILASVAIVLRPRRPAAVSQPDTREKAQTSPVATRR